MTPASLSVKTYEDLCLHAAIAAASAAVLGELFPADRPLCRSAPPNGESRITLGASTRSDVDAGTDLGRRWAPPWSSSAATTAPTTLRPPTWRRAPGAGRPPPAARRSAPTGGPCAPGSWSSPRFRAPPPPRPDSPAFQPALAEVRRLSDAADEEQARIAALWADGPGSYTPAGRWNKIAADLVARDGLDEARAARCFALLNLALMDAGIACWDSKFHYGLLRPSQADPGHQDAGGPAELSLLHLGPRLLLGRRRRPAVRAVPPASAPFLQAKAEEAAVSRMYGGIHYRFDADSGLAQGRAIAALVWSRRGREGADVSHLPGWFQRLSIQGKLVLALGLQLMLVAGVAVGGLIGLRSTRRYFESAIQDGLRIERLAGEMRAELLEARREEKDFLLSWRPDGYRAARDRHVTANQRHVNRLREILAELETLGGAPRTSGDTHARIMEDLVALRPYINVYAEDFLAAVELIGQARARPPAQLDARLADATAALEEQVGRRQRRRPLITRAVAAAAARAGLPGAGRSAQPGAAAERHPPAGGPA